MRLLLRCDAGRSTGVGHAVRCAAVAEAAAAAGHEVLWSGRLDGLAWLWAGLAGADGHRPPGTVLPPADDAGSLAGLAGEHRADAVHVDHYLLGDDLRGPLNSAGIVLCTVEDFTTGRRPGDVVVDPNLGADGHPRPDDGSGLLLRGPAYAPLRAAVRRARRERDAARPAGRPPRVLVVMGGTDAAGLLPRVVAALDAAGAPAEVDVVVPPGRSPRLPAAGPARFRPVAPLPDLPAAMAGADLVVSAAGTTVWELCCVGVPMALVRAADNQAEGYRTVVASGAAAGLGGIDDLAEPEPAGAVLRALLTDPDRRAALARRARTVVDGEGAGRIVDAVAAAVRRGRPRREHPSPSGLHTRPATLDDAELLLAWRNDPDTRRNSRSAGEIDLDSHRRWLAGSLDREDRHLLIVSDAAGPVGTVRWDREPAGWEVSITVAPQRRGGGLAGALLRAGEDALRERTGSGTPLIAVVHRDNIASAKLFARAGYTDDGNGPDDDGFRTLRRIL
ncbi:GNAT family N-acetyltransferase [Pseudonocardia sp. NPDC049635]|uniref:GNAT family N-acetyltransferase n=1 Tax=Pseudonocardia sp. NPDC049635 TaxID=3155506 RepID=UPI0034093C3E